MQRYVIIGAMSFALFLVIGCQSQDGELGDELNDNFLVDGKTDVGGVTEGSAESCGVLKLVNDATSDLLEQEIHLTKWAARAILEYRLGQDAQAATLDDDQFDSLEELDGVSYVGISTFNKLLNYVKKNNLVCQDLVLQIDALADFHGQLDPVSVANVGNVGGAVALASYFHADRKANTHTLLLSAGDSFGASPPLAGFFEEKPVMEAMSLMKFDAMAVGNHEFDRGLSHLKTMIEGGKIPFLSANINNLAANMTCAGEPSHNCIQPFIITYLGGIKVAIIGITTPDVPTLVKPGSFGSLSFSDPVVATKAARAAAAAQGAQAFVLLAHLGGNGGAQSGGPLIDLAKQIPGFDVIIGGHTHLEISTLIEGVPVVETQYQGLEYARIQLKYDFAKRAVIARQSEFVTPKVDAVQPDQTMINLLAPYQTELSKLLDTKIGETTAVFERGNNIERLREVPLGNLLADALRNRYQVDIGFVNGGGLRAPLPSSYLPADHTLRRLENGYVAGPPFDLVIGDVFAVLPFGNIVVTRTVTGAQVWQMLEHSVEYLPVAKGSFAQISGIRFAFDSSKTAGSRVVSVVKTDGVTPIAQDATRYTMATVDFLDLGGDGYTMLAGNSDGITREKIADVLWDYIKSIKTLTPTTDGRIADKAPAPAR